MAVQANLVINDGLAVPVAHTFAPKGAKLSGGIDSALWRDQAPLNMVGFLTLVEEHTPVNKNGMEKFKWTLDLPVLEQASSGGSFVPPPTRAFGGILKIEAWVHQRADAQHLKDLAAYLKNFTALAYVKDAIEKREAAW